jgi:hypothetical protein
LPAFFDITFVKRAWHPSYQRLEEFVLGRLGSPEDPVVVRLEEHLLICSRCVNAVDRTVEYVQMMVDALSGEKASAA